MNTLTSTASSRELLSALADGELSPQELTEALQLCSQDASALGHWAAYQSIGQVLRSQSEVAGLSDTGFLSRLNNRLSQEAPAQAVPTVSAVVLPFKHAVSAPTDSAQAKRDAANDNTFRWKLVAGLASVAAVSAMAWNAAGLLTPAGAPQLAQALPAVQQVLVASPQGTMVRDARLEELLAAHKQMGGTSALQVPSGFLRNATFDTPRNAGR